MPQIETVRDVRHPQIAPLLVVVHQPDAADMAIAFLDHGPRQTAEEALDVRFAHEEIERQLNYFSLHLREALSAAIRVVLANEGGA
ncbi:MAG: hypothetical protein DMG03_07235 [Acidobacteria bacterium]|nr:MAG: hypothetical protein DMG03_07235 [Acidobacteriota bacterium]